MRLVGILDSPFVRKVIEPTPCFRKYPPAGPGVPAVAVGKQ
jgi:hypothetical protein